MPTAKNKLNIALKVAIARTGETQRVLALRARIGEVRLSQIIRGITPAGAAEQKRLARVLGVSVESIFPRPTAAPVRTARAR